MSDINKWLDDAYNCFEIIAEKGLKNGKYQEVIFKFKDTGIEFTRKWVDTRYKPGKEKKNTGGKPSYAMIYTKAIEENEDISLEAAGLLLKLTNKIEWNTQRLRIPRSKAYMKHDELVEIIGKRKATALLIIQELNDLGILKHDGTSYIVSPDFIKKGGTKKDENYRQELIVRRKTSSKGNFSQS